jgi:hypothetical protein
MYEFDSPLNNLKVASPCPADWNLMQGDERKRFCGDCKLNVYNLSGMTKYDAEHLLRMSEGRLCVRYFQRPDGTILTQDCPVGWAKVKQRVSVFAAAAFSLVVSLFAGIFLFSMFRKASPRAVMGAIAIAAPTPALKPKPSPTPIREVKGEADWVVGMRVDPVDPPKLVRLRKSTAVNN